MKRTICGMTPDDLYESVGTHGFSKAHATKVLLSVYRKGIAEALQIKDISKPLREILLSEFDTGVYTPVTSIVSIDDSVRYLFRNSMGLEFETVFIPDGKRNTVCVSTQSGCRIGCHFCCTGRLGFRGNLSAGDIINQILSIPQRAKISHVVFMGMGEPLDNIEEVIKACQILTSEWGLSVSNRNITVSTVGIMRGVSDFIKRTDCNLTLSLYSPFPVERREMVPVETINPVREIIGLLRSYPLRKKRRFSIAYVMIKDLNDTDRHLKELTELLKNSSIRVNLLPFHKTDDDSYVSSDDERMKFFKHHLVVSGISASIRKSRGEDISAACGMLGKGSGLILRDTLHKSGF